MGSEYPLMIYTDHIALKGVLSKGSEGNTRMVSWETRLGGYNLVVHHRPNSDQMMGIADGLSSMPTRWTTDDNPQRQSGSSCSGL